MITEQAVIKVTQGAGPAFEEAVAVAKSDVFSKAEGWRDLTLLKCVEAQDEYIAVITWETLTAHTEVFREGPLFAQWRALVGPFFAAAPEVKHYAAT